MVPDSFELILNCALIYEAECSVLVFYTATLLGTPVQLLGNTNHPITWQQLNAFRHLDSLSAHRALAKRLMHMVHLSGNTSGVSKSSSDWLNYTGRRVCCVL